MVTTRSAEKRIAATGKTEELAVRPKVIDLASSPTPTPSGSKKKPGIVVNVPPPSVVRSKLGNDTFIEDIPASADEESPYTTAQESPESFRDAIASLAEVEQDALLTVQSRKPTVIPSSQETYTSSIDTELVSQTKSQRSPDLTSSIGTRNPQASRDVNVLHTPPQVQSADRDTSPKSPYSDENDENDEAPEVISIRRSGPSLSTASRNKRGRKPALAKNPVQSAPIESDFSKEAPLLNTITQDLQVQPDDQMSASQRLPVLSRNVSEARTDKNGADQDPISSSAMHGIKRKLYNIVNKSALDDTADNQTNTGDSPPMRSTAPAQLNSGESKPFSISLPPKATNSLELYRQTMLAGRVEGNSKRNSLKFRSVQDWNGKRRKFVVAG